jgi:hypothetical protein
MKKVSDSIDPIFGIPLYEDQAFPREKAVKTLDELQDQIADHLVLLFTAKQGAPEIAGWERELNAWRSRLVRRNRGKSGKKNLSSSDLVAALWTEPFESQEDIDFIVNQIGKSKGMNVSRIAGEDVQRFKAFVAKYISSIENDTLFQK